jgi:hypothetical protein
MPARSAGKFRDPKAGRPHMPGYGIAKSKTGMLPWKWGRNQISKSKEYWIATTRPDGSPHLMIIWGLWMDDSFFFSTGKNTRKAKNLAANPHCVIASQDAAQAVIVEGEVQPWNDAAKLKALFAAYKKKYKFDVSEMGEPFYQVKPSVAFGLIEKKFPKTATRWKFSA